MATLTQIKRDNFPHRYTIKDARTKVYRALYGDVASPTRHTHDNGNPAMNERRELPQDWNYQRAEQVFISLAEKIVDGKVMSNGLFHPQVYAVLVKRLETLKKFKHS